jgi:adenine/guanine phosphoribosyltransferase-like PRPP-binding protein
LLPLGRFVASVKSKWNFPHVSCVGEVISEAYVLEYGTDCLEMHVGAVQPGERALVIDDLVATGGTLSAAIKLLGEF